MVNSKLSKTIVLLLSVSFLWLQFLPATSHALPQKTVNAVIGDISFYNRFGSMPTGQTNENLRLQTHLEYVETFLRSRKPSSVPTALYPQREKMLNLLHQYHQRGVFPTQSAFEGRRPHFIDEQGNLCAVGYLVAQTAGREMAETINQRYRYAYLPEMQMPELDHWAAGSGLTTQELAMIQPTYGGLRPVTDTNQQLQAFGYAYSALIIALAITQVISFSLNLGLNIALATGASPEIYQPIQEMDTAITYGSGISLLVASIPSLFMPNSTGGLGVFTSLFIFLPNAASIHFLDDKLKQHQSPKISIGSFQTPDQQMSWGIQASLPF